MCTIVFQNQNKSDFFPPPPPPIEPRKQNCSSPAHSAGPRMVLMKLMGFQ